MGRIKNDSFLALDIETIPSGDPTEIKAEIAETISAPATMKKSETIADWHNGVGKYAGKKEALIEEIFRKRALDGGTGIVISAAYDHIGPSVSSHGNFFTATFTQGPTDSSRSGDAKDEENLLRTLFDYLDISTRAPFFVGHNIRFDLEFLWKRAVILGIKPNFKLPFLGRHDIDFYCTMQAWAGYNKYIAQDELCKILGLPKKPDDINGSNIYDHYLRNDFDRIREYNKSDVKTVCSIYNKLKFQNEDAIK